MRPLTLTNVALLATLLTYAHTPGKGKNRLDVEGKIYFSNKPFGTSNAGAMSSFKSNEFIYGRMELAKTLKESFKLKKVGNAVTHLQCTIIVMKGDEETDTQNGSNNYFKVTDADLESKYLNFDVMPDPAKGTTLFSAVRQFDVGLGFYPMYNTISEEAYPTGGDYKIKVIIYNEMENSWGTLEPRDTWPTLEGEFNFTMNEADIETLVANRTKARESSRESAYRYDKLPPVFANPGPMSDPNATAAKISAILKRDLPERTIIKFVAEKYSGLQWHVANDEIGLPKYKYFNPHIWVAYRMDGKCHVGNVTLRQNYEGGGRFGPLQVGFTSASEHPDGVIDCALLK